VHRDALAPHGRPVGGGAAPFTGAAGRPAHLARLLRRDPRGARPDHRLAATTARPAAPAVSAPATAAPPPGEPLAAAASAAAAHRPLRAGQSGAADWWRRAPQGLALRLGARDGGRALCEAVELVVVTPAAAYLEWVEMVFKDQYRSRGDIWYWMQQLIDQCVLYFCNAISTLAQHTSCARRRFHQRLEGAERAEVL